MITMKVHENVQLEEIRRVYGKISPFELKNKLINLAEGSKKKSINALLNAGRGNPNWTASLPREAFFTFGQFAVLETKRVWEDKDLAGMPSRPGIAERLNDYLTKNTQLPGADLIRKIIEYGSSKGFTADRWVFELVDGIIGDNYPVPDRMLIHIEKVVQDYLIKEMGYDSTSENNFNIFAVEGATAAMCYIFDSLIANKLLKIGDSIAIMTPIFTPYLEIPHLERYNFSITEIKASNYSNDINMWQYDKSEIEKLCNKDIKALFVVNPSNPPSVAIKPDTINELVKIVHEHNPDLMIISDDVYCTFVEKFRSLAAYLPFNTIGVYSFSKYFGVTGWRLGTIAIHKNNVFDKLLQHQSAEDKDELYKRYEALSTNPEKICFIDRIVADSRQVALNHTAGLSTPQQVQMAFFCIFALTDKENNYKKLTQNICHHREELLYKGLHMELKHNPYDAAYYTEFDLLQWAGETFNKDFADYLQKNHKPVDILLRLAEESSIVLLNGGGFHGPEWSIRISLANLRDESYLKIGEYLHKILEDYVLSWENEKNK